MIRPKISSLFLSLLLAITSMANWAVASEKEKASPSQSIILLVDEFTPGNRVQEDSDLAFALRAGLLFALRAYPSIAIVDISGRPTPGSSEIGSSRIEGAVSRPQEDDVHRLEASYYSKGTFVNLGIRVTRGPNEETVFSEFLKFERTAALTNMELLARRFANEVTQLQQGEPTAMPVRWRRGAVGCFETWVDPASPRSLLDPASPLSLEELEPTLIEELSLKIAKDFPDLFIRTVDEFGLVCSGEGTEALLMAAEGPDFLVSGRIEAKPTTFVVRPTLFAKGFPMPLRLPKVQVPHDDWYDLVFLVFSGVANFLFAGRDDQGFWSEPELVLQQSRPEDLIATGRERLLDDRPSRAALYFIVARDRSREDQPLYDQASLGLAQIRQQQGLAGEAREILERISESANVSSEANRMLGDLAYESGKFNDARDAYLKAYELGNRSSSLLWRAAESQLRDHDQDPKDKEKALMFLNEWVDQQPVALLRFVSAASLLDEYGAKEEANGILLKSSTTQIAPGANTLETTLDFIKVHNKAASTQRFDAARSIGEKVVALAKDQEGADGEISLGLGYAILGYSESARYAHTEEGDIDKILFSHKTALTIFTKFQQMASPDISFNFLDVMYRMELLNFSEASFVAQKYEMSRSKSREAIDTFSDLAASDIALDIQSDIVISYLLLTISQIMLGVDESKSLTLLRREQDRLGKADLVWDFSFVGKAAADQIKDLCEGEGFQASGCKNMGRVHQILKEISQSKG